MRYFDEVEKRNAAVFAWITVIFILAEFRDLMALVTMPLAFDVGLGVAWLAAFLFALLSLGRSLYRSLWREGPAKEPQQ